MSSRSALDGRRIVITRPEGADDSLARSLQSMGAIPLRLPSTRLEALRQVEGLQAALGRLQQYHWVIFSSANAVEFFWRRLEAAGLSGRELAKCSVAAIGPATASALRANAIEVDFVSEQHVGGHLGKTLPDVKGRRVLLPAAADARPELPRNLRGRGAIVDEFAIYRSVQNTPDQAALGELASGVDAVTFTSPSTVKHFLGITESAGFDPFSTTQPPAVACIGPVTAAAAEEAGLREVVVAESYTVAGLLEALVGYFEEHRVTERHA